MIMVISSRLTLVVLIALRNHMAVDQYTSFFVFFTTAWEQQLDPNRCAVALQRICVEGDSGSLHFKSRFLDGTTPKESYETKSTEYIRVFPVWGDQSSQPSSYISFLSHFLDVHVCL